LRRLEDDTPPTLPAGGRLGGGMLAIDGIVDGLNETRGKE
jgi:hypothetical protein